MAEKSLMGILMEDNSSTRASLLASLRFAVLPIVKVFTLCFMGFLMASKYINILPANGRKLLNGVILLSDICKLLLVSLLILDSNNLIGCYMYVLQLVFSLLLPCLIFSELGRAITLQKILEWYVFQLCIYTLPEQSYTLVYFEYLNNKKVKIVFAGGISL